MREASASGASRASPWASAVWSGSWPTGTEMPTAIRPAKPAVPNGHKVAVVGSGPAGLTCAGDLARKGYDVTVFEALHTGRRRAGVRHPRVPSAQGHRARRRWHGLKRLGVKIETDTVVGRTITVDELLDEMGFEAVFIGSGAGLPMFMDIPGENLQGRATPPTSS